MDGDEADFARGGGEAFSEHAGRDRVAITKQD
jgi:hypothetical protein